MFIKALPFLSHFEQITFLVKMSSENLVASKPMTKSSSPRKRSNPDQEIIKLSIINEFFPPDYAATGQLIDELARQLEQEGISIEVFTGQPGYAFAVPIAASLEEQGNIRIQRSRSTQLWSTRIRGKMIRGIVFTIRAFFHILKNSTRYNLFLLTTAPPFLAIAGYLAHLLSFGRISYVCLIYDLYPDIAIGIGVIPPHHKIVHFWRGINQQIWKKSKGIIVLSSGMKKQIGLIAPDVLHKVTVISSWSDPQSIIPLAKAQNWFAQEHHLVHHFTVLYSGNMGRCHDLNTILETMRQLKDEPIQFVFIGGGPKLEKLHEQVAHYELKNILVLPYQDKQVLPYSLTACDLSLVTVAPGMENLVAPSKLYSALAAGRPIAVICPPHSYLNQVITEGQCGLAIENGDSAKLSRFIRQLSNDKKLAEKLGNASRSYLEKHFTPKIIARQYLQFLRKSIAS